MRPGLQRVTIAILLTAITEDVTIGQDPDLCAGFVNAFNRLDKGMEVLQGQLLAHVGHFTGHLLEVGRFAGESWEAELDFRPPFHKVVDAFGEVCAAIDVPFVAGGCVVSELVVEEGDDGVCY